MVGHVNFFDCILYLNRIFERKSRLHDFIYVSNFLIGWSHTFSRCLSHERTRSLRILQLPKRQRLFPQASNGLVSSNSLEICVTEILCIIGNVWIFLWEFSVERSCHIKYRMMWPLPFYVTFQFLLETEIGWWPSAATVLHKTFVYDNLSSRVRNRINTNQLFILIDLQTSTWFNLFKKIK